MEKIFEDKKVDMRQSVLTIVVYFSEISPMKPAYKLRQIITHKLRQIIAQDVWLKLLVGFFDGTCNNSHCGC